MRIGVCGAQCTGKSTFIKDFVETWPMYETPKTTYRDLVKKKKLAINKEGDRDSQMAILNYHIDEIQGHNREDNIIVDRCVIDPLVYSMWLYEKKTGNISDDDIELMLRLVREGLKLYDIIFWLPHSKLNPIPMPDEDHMRDKDDTYRDEINNIFESINKTYIAHSGTVFPLEDCPAFIDIIGSREERIATVKMYLTPEGKAYGEDESLLKEIITP